MAETVRGEPVANPFVLSLSNPFVVSLSNHERIRAPVHGSTGSPRTVDHLRSGVMESNRYSMGQD